MKFVFPSVNVRYDYRNTKKIHQLFLFRRCLSPLIIRMLRISMRKKWLWLKLKNLSLPMLKFIPARVEQVVFTAPIQVGRHLTRYLLLHVSTQFTILCLECGSFESVTGGTHSYLRDGFLNLILYISWIILRGNKTQALSKDYNIRISWNYLSVDIRYFRWENKTRTDIQDT